MSEALPEGYSWEKKLDAYIAQTVAASINNDLLDALTKLWDYCAGRDDVPMYVLAMARNALVAARRAKETT
jgi:hypothetical protein